MGVTPRTALALAGNGAGALQELVNCLISRRPGQATEESPLIFADFEQMAGTVTVSGLRGLWLLHLHI